MAPPRTVEVERKNPMSARSDLERLSKLAARSCYIGNHEAIALVLGGRFQMFLDTTDAGIFPHLALTGFWESWVTLVMMQIVKPGMRVANIGANVGYYALLFADLVGPTGYVAAYEPNTVLVNLLRRSATLNGYHHLNVIASAVGDESGVAEFIIPESHPMNAHLANVAGAIGNRREVLITRLDDASEVPEVVFIDAEGAEGKIWRGMTDARAEHATIVMEYSPKRYADPLAFARELASDEAFALGYIHDSGTVNPITPEELAAGPEVMAVLRKKAKP
jgi:FkbM family methyltransferase